MTPDTKSLRRSTWSRDLWPSRTAASGYGVDAPRVPRKGHPRWVHAKDWGRSMADETFNRANNRDAPSPDSEKSGGWWALQVVLGALVLAAGVLLLLDTVFPDDVPGLVWSVLLVGGAAAFGFAFFSYPSWWWAAIPAGALLGAAAAPVMELDPAGSGQWTEVPFLSALSLGFWAVYLKDHRRWWAIIPGGVLLTLAVVSGATEAVGGVMTGAIFLFGLSATFALVAALPTGRSRHRWAWIAAGVLAAVGLVVVLQSAELLVVLAYVWPIAIIGGGAYLLFSAWQRRRTAHDTAPATSGEPAHDTGAATSGEPAHDAYTATSDSGEATR
jgi:hypothetical protein